MRRLYTVLERAAPTQATVLIQGETGTGKELVARELHRHSRRSEGPFVPVDCGAIAPNVIESELFGHTRGAFSGAVSDRRGLIEEAHGGTLFLDEVGELPLNLQAKLLRVLETREVRRVGANTARAVDVRLVAATHRMLAQSVNEGSFREDLYYRLAVVEVQLPPLRFRREDLPLLADHFYRRLTGDAGAIPHELVAVLMTRSWPGNVRELRNFIERCVTLGITSPGPASSREGPISARDGIEAALPLNLHVPLKEARDEALERLEHIYVQSVLRRSEGNVTRAAELAGVSRRFLQRLISRLGIRDVAAEHGDGDVE
jgi:DNA-binding NtrC family response regulator